MTLGGNALEGESDGAESEEGCNDEGENDEWREKGVPLCSVAFLPGPMIL